MLQSHLSNKKKDRSMLQSLSLPFGSGMLLWITFWTMCSNPSQIIFSSTTGYVDCLVSITINDSLLTWSRYVESWIQFHVKKLKYLILVTALVKWLFLGSISLCFVITDTNLWLLRYCFEFVVSWTNTWELLGGGSFPWSFIPCAKNVFIYDIKAFHIYSL